MRLSKKFLNDYINISDINYHELAEKMVFAGNEYESINKMCEATNLVVGEVIECINHPKSDHLHICQVNIGEKIVQIVCGAPNVTKDIKVIVANVGAVLPGGITIKEAELAGTLSQGMICSIEELGIENKFLKEEDKDGIHILNSDAIVGEDPLKYLNFDDEIIDFELTANRADLMSILGMAYEVGAIYDREVKEPIIELNESKEKTSDYISLDVETDNCSIYLGKVVKNIELKESPDFIKARLIASNIRPINNVVDISNYVMLEYGQPLHFFDLDKLGNKVIVRMANDSELITTLDSNERVLTNNDIVIANETPAALAGVMGGLSTEVESDTKNIFIESAIFDSPSIRNTSKKILRSEASSRYEKGIDPNRTLKALNRAAYLLQEYASGEVLSGIVSYDEANKEDKDIDITLDKINSVLGMNLSINNVTDTLRRLNFIYNVNGNDIKVIVPTRRLDVNIKEDLIEEIGRIIGYDNMEGILPTVPIKQGKISLKNKYIKDIKNRLSSLGLNEVITYSLTNEDDINKFNCKEYENIYIKSPMSEDKKVMRHSLIPSLLNVFDYNFSRNNKDICIYESGSNYYLDNGSYVEEARVAGLLYGNYLINNWQNNIVKIDFYVLKGIIENLLDYLGLNGRYSFSSKDLLSDLHPGMSASIIVDNQIIGYIGKVHPNINKKDIYVFELNIDLLMSKKVRGIKYKEVSKYPSVNKDLAFIVKKDIEAIEIEKVIKKVGGRLLNSIEVFDVYTGENVADDEKSLAFSLNFQDSTRTLNDEEVTEVFNKIIHEVEIKLNAVLRNK